MLDNFHTATIGATTNNTKNAKIKPTLPIIEILRLFGALNTGSDKQQGRAF
jgi:hypothetical protein